jgi:hypothetical protein
MTSCDDTEFKDVLAAVKDGAFAKDAMIKTACQNFVFDVAQLTQLLGEINMSNDKLKAIPLFKDSLTDPQNASKVETIFSMSADKQAAVKAVSAFKPAVPFKIADFKIEDDGHRDIKEVNRFCAAIKAKPFSSDKIDVVKKEILEHPSPPFEPSHLVLILKELPFSADAAAVLALFVGPKIVYPMTCTEIVNILKVFGMSDDQLKVLPTIKHFIKDAQHKHIIVSSFGFSSDKAKAEEILRDVVVKRVPEVPPAAKIQQALKTIGRCPSGYAWVQVSGGWRCAAGGHFVSDEQLKKPI